MVLSRVLLGNLWFYPTVFKEYVRRVRFNSVLRLNSILLSVSSRDIRYLLKDVKRNSQDPTLSAYASYK